MDALPSLIGRYQIRQQLGQGGMGVLYLAFDPTMDRLVALKLLRVNDAQWRERFLREARLVARLQHPNIITIHDVGSTDGQPFMAMEYIAGNTLDTIVRRHVPLSRARKLEIMIALCDGLAYAHRSGVIHRDVKPSNLIVHRDSGLLKVLDFGIARTNDSSLTLVGAIMGTPNYMSPEQVQGLFVDHRSDVFAVGVVLYELFAHRQAFSGETPFLVLQEIVHSTPAPLVQIDPTIDPMLDRIVSRAIAKDPQDRYPDLDVMRRDLIDALRHTEQEQPWGREKTMVLLARAAGAGRGTSPAEPVALVTPPPASGPPASGPVSDPISDPALGGPASRPALVEAGEVTNVLLTPADDPSPDELRQEQDQKQARAAASSETYVAPESLLMPTAVVESGDSGPIADPDPDGVKASAPVTASDSRLMRIGLFAAAAAMLLVVLPIVLLMSRASKPRAAEPAPTPPLAAATLPAQAQTAPLTPAVASQPAPPLVEARPPEPSPSAAPPRVAARVSGPTRGIEAPAPTPTEPAAGRSDLREMQQALNRWKEAYESRDVAAVSRAWPTISGTQARSLDTAFDKMSQMTVLLRQCSMGGTVMRASATCHVERSIKFKTGRSETVPSNVAFQLEKRAARWVIVGVRGA